MSAPYFAANPSTFGQVPTAHDQYNGEGHHHGMHENGRAGPPSHHQYQQLTGYGQPSYPTRYPYTIDRMVDTRPIDGTNAHHEPSPFGYGALPGPPLPPQQPPPAQDMQRLTLNQSQYDSCGSRPSITPPHDQQQYPSCKMQPVHPHSDISPNGVGPGGSPTSQSHQIAHQMYPGPVPSPGQTNSGAAMNNSPLYPWMRSQFGEYSPFCCFVHIYLHALR